MARKNLFGITPPEVEKFESVEKRTDRPLAGLNLTPKAIGPVGAISQSLEHMNARAQRADDIEKQLSQGLAIVELSPDLIDGSFITDRLGLDATKLAELTEHIRVHGQQVPILVRPHPTQTGRYQVAYGHRRLAAVKSLGTTVRAVTRELTNDQLVISQGQENNARTDLTYIEKCLFAWKLEIAEFSRDTIMAALNVDKTVLSRMISLVLRLPEGLGEAIGAAPTIGRQRWNELADMLVEASMSNKAKKLIKDPNFETLNSDDRFVRIYEGLKVSTVKKAAKARSLKIGSVSVQVNETEKKISLAFDKRDEAGFASYVEAQLNRLFGEYKSSETKTNSGD